MNVVARTGWTILALCSFAGWVLLPNTDFWTRSDQGGDVDFALGRVHLVWETLVTHGGGIAGGEAEPIYGHTFSFATPDGRRVVVEGYATGRMSIPGSRVTVEYDVARPEVAKVAGTKRRLYTPTEALATPAGMLGLVLGPVAGVLLLAAGGALERRRKAKGAPASLEPAWIGWFRPAATVLSWTALAVRLALL